MRNAINTCDWDRFLALIQYDRCQTDWLMKWISLLHLLVCVVICIFNIISHDFHIVLITAEPAHCPITDFVILINCSVTRKDIKEFLDNKVICNIFQLSYKILQTLISLQSSLIIHHFPLSICLMYPPDLCSGSKTCNNSHAVCY